MLPPIYHLPFLLQRLLELYLHLFLRNHLQRTSGSQWTYLALLLPLLLRTSGLPSTCHALRRLLPLQLIFYPRSRLNRLVPKRITTHTTTQHPLEDTHMPLEHQRSRKRLLSRHLHL
jgi:hypothetical protein